jgi:hypothetical protein
MSAPYEGDGLTSVEACQSGRVEGSGAIEADRVQGPASGFLFVLASKTERLRLKGFGAIFLNNPA